MLSFLCFIVLGFRSETEPALGSGEVGHCSWMLHFGERRTYN